MKIAIYSRKSKFTGKGESIENQIVLCREYIKTHIPEADSNEIYIYEDEGFSAKNLDRPQFKAMMKAAEKTPFDYIVVYRLDRISRNVGDFAGLIEKLNEMKTAFICIKEQFDTSTPMGRAMMNIAAVFAQLERETIAERIRDNLILLARTGRWLGGVTPLGFVGEKTEIKDAENKKRSAFKLSSVQNEIKTVKAIYEKFLEFKSLTKTTAWLIAHDFKTREGNDFRIRAVKDILKNPVYCSADKAAREYFVKSGCDVCFGNDEADEKHGIMPFCRTSQSGSKTRRNNAEDWIIALGKHKGVISSQEWIEAQNLLYQNSSKSFYKSPRNETAVYSGIVCCGFCGSNMRIRVNSRKYDNADGSRTFSYMCELKERSRMSKCSMKNLNGNVFDKMACGEILKLILPGFSANKLNELLKCSEDKSQSVAELKKQINRKEKLISKLMQTLAQTENTGAMYDYTKREVERIDREIKSLCAEIEQFEVLDEKNEIRIKQIKEIERDLKSFSENFEKLNVAERRDFMRGIIEKIVWDGENAHIFLKNKSDYFK